MKKEYCMMITCRRGRFPIKGTFSCMIQTVCIHPHLALFEHGDLLLQRDVLLLQLGVVLQQTSLPELVLFDVIAQLIPLELHHLAVL